MSARDRKGISRTRRTASTPGLAALHFYQLALPTPKPPAGTFIAAAAKNGERIFNGKAKCGTCHVPPIFTEPGWNLHTAEEIGIDDLPSARPTGATGPRHCAPCGT